MSQYRKKPVVVEAEQTSVHLRIETLEGTMLASPGDWIITGVQGERYPCKPDVFAQTYEPADTPTAEARVAVLERALELLRGWDGRCCTACPAAGEACSTHDLNEGCMACAIRAALAAAQGRSEG